MAGLLEDLSPEDWERVDRLLDEALDRTGPQRQAYLDALPEADRVRVAALVERIEGSSPVDRALRLAGQVDVGSTIGSWTIGEPLGEGGASVVFAATHTDGDFPMEAALKLLRGGPGAGPFRERFRRERQILLGLRHPLIVRILDGGTTDSGIPFYVMERIEGEPVTVWCARQPISARLELMIAVCGAVEYAHQRLIVHCDLKPDNLIVDARGVPRVLDFGIAKLLEDSEVTQTGHRMLTPRWAAPEQVDGEAVTTATDVYALGLLLWSALTGRPPRQGLTGSALLADVSRNPVPAPSIDEPRARGDLDAIVAKACATDPAERYRGAAELGEDLRRSLDGHAVRARERAPLYQTVRFVRRHPTAVVTGLIFLGVLMAWAGSATLQSRQIALERDRAQLQAARAESALDLLVDMLEAADPAEARGEELTAKEVLASGIRELGIEGRDPELQGELLLVVGRVQYATGDLDSALDTLQRAHELLLATKGERDPQTRRAVFHTARAVFEEQPVLGLAQAEGLLAAYRPQPPSIELANTLLLVAEMKGNLNEMWSASEFASQAFSVYSDLGDRRGAARARAIEGYAAIRLDRSDGRAILLDALDEMEQALGTSKHPQVADILHELALVTPGEEGRELAKRSVDLRRDLFGETWALAATLNNYALHLEATDPDAAIALLTEAVRIAGEARGPAHPKVLNLRLNLGAVLVDARRMEEGERVLREVLKSDSITPHVRDRVLVYLEKIPME